MPTPVPMPAPRTRVFGTLSTCCSSPVCPASKREVCLPQSLPRLRLGPPTAFPASYRTHPRAGRVPFADQRRSWNWIGMISARRPELLKPSLILFSKESSARGGSREAGHGDDSEAGSRLRGTPSGDLATRAWPQGCIPTWGARALRGGRRGESAFSPLRPPHPPNPPPQMAVVGPLDMSVVSAIPACTPTSGMGVAGFNKGRQDLHEAELQVRPRSRALGHWSPPASAGAVGALGGWGRRFVTTILYLCSVMV